MYGPGRLSFLGGQCPRNFRLRTLILEPRDAIDYQPTDWATALVIVERGQLQIECRTGAQARFQEGAILAFAGLEIRRLRNPSSTPLVLSALSPIRAAD